MTADGQPSGSVAWDLDAVQTNPDGLKRHLEALARTAAIQEAWSHALSAMRLQVGQRVLDVGCGTGAFLPTLGIAAGAGGSVVGLDHAPRLLDEARHAYQASGAAASGAFVAGDAHRLPFADAVFDAAHTERVLIHLLDPDRALRELCRVVRPGGRVVAVEPDFLGWRIDHPDQDAIRQLIAGFGAAIRHPAMGLELNRRMTECGFVDVQVNVITEVERAYPEDVAVHYREAAGGAVERGWLTRERAGRTLQALDDAGRHGRFMTYSSMFIVAGRVPEKPT